MSYTIPLKARDVCSAVQEAKTYLNHADTAKLRAVETEGSVVILFVWKGHIASVSCLHDGTWFLRGHNSDLRFLLKGSKHVYVSGDGSIKWEGKQS